MSRRKKHRLVAEINVVPYIDVMLVLLVVFMITAPLLMQGVQVDLPQAPSTPMEDKDEPLIVSIDAQGQFFINLGKDEKQAKSLAHVAEQVQKILAVKPRTPVMVWGDRNVPYGSVGELMTALQTVGASDVGLVTEPPS